MNHYRLASKLKIHTDNLIGGLRVRFVRTKRTLHSNSENSALVHWYKWFICYLNKFHVFATYIDKNGVTKIKCIRCGVERPLIKGD